MPARPADGWTNETTYDYVSDGTLGMVYITVFVNDDGNYYSKQAAVEVTDALYTANIYVNATENNPTFSAYRVNANGGLKLTTQITNMNNDPIDGTVEYAVCVPGGEIMLSNDTGVFMAEELKTLQLNKEYWVRVSLKVDDETVAYAGRLIYLTNYGASYTTYNIDGRVNGSGIAVNKNNDIDFSITFDEGNPDENELYASYMVVPYSESYEDDSYAVAQGEYTKTSGLVYSGAVTGLEGQPRGAYNLVWKAKKTQEQSYVDRTVAKCVYLYSRIALVNNIYLNGSMNSALGNPEALTLKAHWMDSYFERVAPELTYKYEIYKSANDLSAENLVYTSDEVTGNETVTIDDISTLGLGFENTVKLSIYRDGVLDHTVCKIFYPTVAK